MSQSAKTPEPPNYAAATKEAIVTDVDTLAMRRAIESAAAMGKVYAGGKVYDDMTAFNAAKTDTQTRLAAAMAADRAALGLDENTYKQAVAITLGKTPEDVNKYLNALSGGLLSANKGGSDEEKAYQIASTGGQDFLTGGATALLNPNSSDKDKAASILTGGISSTIDNLFGGKKGDTYYPISDEVKQLTQEISGYEKVQDFNGLSDADKTSAYLRIMLDAEDESARRQYALRTETDENGVSLGERNAQQSAKELEAADPETYAARKELLETLKNNQDNPAQTDENLLSILDTVKQQYENKGLDPTTKQLLEDTFTKYQQGYSLDENVSKLVEDAASKYALGGKLDDTVRTEVEQNARAGQAARGNILGNASAYAESQEVGQAAEARELQRGQTLLQMAGVADSLKTAGEQNLLNNALNLTNTADARGQQSLGNFLNIAGTLDSQKYGREQQSLANLSNFISGGGISNQFGNLAGAQFGAVANSYSPINQVQTGTTLNPNAAQQGASFALGNYGNQVSYADSQNPWGVILGAAGAGVGAYFGGPAGAQAGASTGTALGKLGGISF